jgi:transposase-like protein
MEADNSSAQRYYRYGEAFWRELIARQAQSSQGIRNFCQANGLATSTFHKWRAKLAERAEVASTEHRSVPDAMFIAVAHDPTPIAQERAEPTPLPQSRGNVRDSIIVTSGGMRVEMTGAYADRIVRHLLSRMNGFTC